jgi:putative DNA primase/helicase
MEARVHKDERFHDWAGRAATLEAAVRASMDAPSDLDLRGEAWQDSTAEAADTSFHFGSAPVGLPPTNGKPIAPNELPDDPHRLARVAIDQSYKQKGQLLLRTYRDERHLWDGTAYRRIDESEVGAELTRLTKQEMDRLNRIEIEEHQKRFGENTPGKPYAQRVTRAMVGNALNAFTSLTILPSSIEAPAWLDGRGPFPADEILAARNGLLHLPSLERGQAKMTPHTPNYFSPFALDYDYDSDAPLPGQWIKFLGDLWPDDPAAIQTLQEWIGYLLSQDTRQQKILLLVGPKRSGKGTIARVIRGLLGMTNVAGPTLSSLAINFGLWPLLEKSVAIISDARLSGRTDAGIVTERLLSISGEDPLTVDRKYLPPITVKIPSRLMILTNELPRLSDSSGALASRMIVLSLTRSWYGMENMELTDILLRERAGILLWAIDGLRRLRERGHFIQPESGRQLVEQLEVLSSPISELSVALPA